MIPFLDMEWWCNHAIAIKKCPECGTFAHILTDVSRNDDENDIDVTCEKCGKKFDITICGNFEKIKFLEDDTIMEIDPKKQALIDAEKMLDPCPLCGKRENVTIACDIVGMTTIKCSCGLTVGPIFGIDKCVERYNNRAGENRIMQDLWEYQDKAEYYEDLVKRLNGDSIAPDPEPEELTRIDELIDNVLPF